MYEELIHNYLKYVRKRFYNDPELEQVKCEEIESALHLDKVQSRLLKQLIMIGNYWGGSASMGDNWSVGLPSDIDEIPEDIHAYLQEYINRKYNLSYEKAKVPTQNTLTQEVNMDKEQNEGIAMNIFLSWSGERSKKLAILVRDWLPKIIEGINTWISTEIPKGKEWFAEIERQIINSDAGIVCLTKDNPNEPWLLFESGALWIGSEHKVLYTLLLDIKTSAIKGPLSFFQHTLCNKDELRKMVEAIIDHVCQGKADKTKCLNLFDEHWSDFEKELDEIFYSGSVPEPNLKGNIALDGLVVHNIRRYIKEDMEFIMDYTSPTKIKVSLFDPPDGKWIMKTDDIKPGKSTLAFKVSMAAIKRGKVSSLTIKFWIDGRENNDNTIFFGLNELQ
jgi:hypothetical protein